ncbi:MAG: ABC transporter permease [Muribaculaceae bacterium]
MRFELFIARRLKLKGSNERSAAPNLTIAVIGMVLAIVVMILSITIVCGFKREISNKIFNIDPHIKVTNSAVLVNGTNYSTVDALDVMPIINSSNLAKHLSSVSLIAEKPAILKTDNDFKGIVYRGVDSCFCWDFFKSCLTGGRVPLVTDSANVAEVIISQKVASQLRLNVGDKVLTYFIDERVRVRRSLVVGIFSTDFDEFDNSFIVGNIAALQGVNGWQPNIGTYIGINTRDIDEVQNQAYDIYRLLSRNTIDKESPILYSVTDTTNNNSAYFSWLDLLDMNVIIIIILMTVVSAFTLIAGLLMIVLERINMIGILKTLGATNGSTRRVFIYLTQKLILKSLIYGNALGIGFALLQQHFHLLKLDAESYYIPYVPIEINWLYIIALNVGVVVVSYFTLLAPSMIISSIKPSKSIKFE